MTICAKPSMTDPRHESNMDEWLDSLSEDWISQPRSSHSNSVLNTPPLPGDSSHESHASQSRIPRYNPRSVSGFSSGASKVSGRRSSSAAIMNQNTALVERSPSNMNASQRQRPKGHTKLNNPTSESKQRSKRQASTSSLPSMRQDTVQHKPAWQSPRQGSNSQATPEWKKRVLHGNTAPGDPCDLFSPIGLEKVFKPPTLGQKTTPKRGAKPKPAAVEDYRSSPLPNPLDGNKIPERGNPAASRDRSPVLPSLIKNPGERDANLKVPTSRKMPLNSEPEQMRTRGKSKLTQSPRQAVSPQLKRNASHHTPNKSPTSIGRHAQRKSVLPSECISPQAKLNTTRIGGPSAGFADAQNVSIQTDDRDEKISPFYISRRQTNDGRIDYAALDMSMHQLRAQMEDLREQQQHRPLSPLSDNGVDNAEPKSVEDIPLLGTEDNDWTSQSLPEGLSTGTDAFVASGGFVNVRRGGYSIDGSFQRRPLSPSSSTSFENPDLRSSNFSGSVIVDRNLKASSQVEPVKRLPFPTTPKKELVNSSSSQGQAKSSGSPLKLFDKYDTFTNDRLSRRMSKFEEVTNQDTYEIDEIHIEEDSASTTPSYPASKPRQEAEQQVSSKSRNQSKTRVSSFGEGELDGHMFPSYKVSAAEPEAYEERVRGSSVPDPNAFRFERVSRSASQSQNATKKNFPDLSKPSPLDLKRARKDDGAQDKLATKLATKSPPDHGKEKSQKEDLRNAQGKRLPISPAKNSSKPKRRRTLQLSGAVDLETSHGELATDTKASIMKSVVGRKRKDALYDGQSQAADPKVLAMRQMLRPRSSTLSRNNFQGRSPSGGTAIDVEDEKFQAVKIPESSQLQQIKLDPPTQELAEELATFTLDMVQDITCGSRKASVTTADFFNEAKQIMQLIRAQGRPPSSHGIVEESEPDSHESREDSFVEESTKDEFSRPPSRAGASLRRLREPAPVDARIVSHLRKFEDKDDFGITLSSSLKSLHIKPSSAESPDRGTGRVIQSDGNRVESDPPNVRILHHNVQLEIGKVSSLIDDVPVLTTDNQTHSTGSRSTSGPSTGRSLHTLSSRGSGNKVVIPPEKVSHLLSDQIAGMAFDHQKQVWVKHRTSSKTEMKGHSRNGSEMTDDDLLGEIPDLSVDELEEMQRTKDAASSFRRMGSSSNGISNHDYAKIFETSAAESLCGDEFQDNRPRPAEAVHSATNEDCSSPSKNSRFAPSGPSAETRATSWGDDVLPQTKIEVPSADSLRTSEDHDEQHDEEVEHEISISEGRQSRTPTKSTYRDRQARVVTVSFSSPLTDQIQTPCVSTIGPDTWQDESDLDLDDSPIQFDSQQRPTMSRRSGRSSRRSCYRSASRRISFGSQSYIARPMSRLDEQDEISFLQCTDGAQNARLDVVVSTPLSFRGSMIGPQLPSTGHSSSVGFHLSPLADFTLHQTDSPNPGPRDLAKRRGLLPLHEVEGKFSLATQDLVKQLTDLEPYEPYWDFIRSIDLQKRGLVTLHMLDEYCRRIEELNVSDNSLDQLDGAPSTVRDLNVCRNQLSDLTAWGHLQNLQYLDVSHNQIGSLKGFQGLVHLRELRLDDNQLESLDGIFEHDGLIKLSLRRNLVKSIDFGGSNL